MDKYIRVRVLHALVCMRKCMRLCACISACVCAHAFAHLRSTGRDEKESKKVFLCNEWSDEEEDLFKEMLFENKFAIILNK